MNGVDYILLTPNFNSCLDFIWLARSFCKVGFNFMKFVLHDLSEFPPAHSHGDLTYSVCVNEIHLPCWDLAWASKYSFLDRYGLSLLEIKWLCPTDEILSPSVWHLAPREWILRQFLSLYLSQSWGDPELLEGTSHAIFSSSVPGTMQALGSQCVCQMHKRTCASLVGAWPTSSGKNVTQGHVSLTHLQEACLGFWYSNRCCMQLSL